MNRCKNCGKFGEQTCPKCREEAKRFCSGILDALSSHGLTGKSHTGTYDTCKCGWKGYPYRDHTSLVVYTHMLRMGTTHLLEMENQ